MRDKIVKLLDENDERLYHGKVTSKELADRILALLDAELEKMQKGLDAVQDLINNSYGVAGLHLNGDVAPWDELLEGGRFEDWLKDFPCCGRKIEVSP